MVEKEIPSDVQEYLQIMSITGGMMGLEMYRRCKSIVENNPTWFPWEHKYKSLPQEVHDAYLDEKNPDRHLPFAFETMRGNNGVIPDIRNKEAFFDCQPKESFLEMWHDFVKTLEKERKEREEIENSDKALWDKHYKKYELEWRSDRYLPK